MAAVEIKNLSFQYALSKSPALHDVSCCIEEGEFVLLFGASGSGKTTLLSLLKPEIAPAGSKSGSIRLFGNEEGAFDFVGYVSQNPDAQMVADTVYRELSFGLENTELDEGRIRRRIAETADYFGLNEILDKKIHELSGGQKQVCNLCAALCLSPKLLLLDEPIARLDPIAAESFLAVLRRIHQQTGITILLSEHRTESLLCDCDRVLFLENGSLSFDGDAPAFCDYLSENHPLLAPSLPESAQIAYQLNTPKPLPLTVAAGKKALEHYKDRAVVTPRQSNQPSGRLLQARELWFAYHKKDQPVIRGASLDVFAGEVHALVGGNGEGKSTLLSLLGGAIRPARGSIQKAKGVRCALLPQDARLLFVRDTLFSDLMEFSDRFSYDESNVKQILEQMDLTVCANRHPYDLSGGETQKAALAKLLLTGAQVLLLDEPVNGLDAEGKREMTRLCHSLVRNGKAVVLITHDLAFAAETADTVTMVSRGQTLPRQSIREFLLENRFFTTASARLTATWQTAAISPGEVSSRE